MTLSEKVFKVLCDQVNAELYSSYIYLSMSSWFDSTGYSGFAKWMRAQADEEREHAMKIYDYILERNGRVILAAIPAPKSEWSSVKEVFADTLAHEQKVSAMINNIADVSFSEKDYATVEFMNWFLKEQVEEEASVGAIVDKIEMIGESKNSMYLLDRDLGKRVG
ncbi:MAG: ferritin [Ignavibacteriaceae bacterium]|nr:ferritin [Ignavibacteriaceae bacterium]